MGREGSGGRPKSLEDGIRALTGEGLEEDGGDWSCWMHARSLAFAAEHHLHHDEPAAALELAAEAIAILNGLTAEGRSARELTVWLEAARASGIALLRLGRSAEARDLIAFQHSVLDLMDLSEPGNTLAPQARPFVARDLADAAARAGDDAATLRHLLDAVAGLEALVDGGDAFRAHDLLAAMADLSEWQRGRGEAARSAGLARAALERARRLDWAASDPETGEVVAVLLRQAARADHDDGRFEAAMALALEALALRDRRRSEAVGGEVDGERVRLWILLAELGRALDRRDDALPYALSGAAAARDDLALGVSTGRRLRLAEAEIVLAETQQWLGHYGDAALVIDAAERALTGLAADGIAVAETLVHRLAALRRAQPALH